MYVTGRVTLYTLLVDKGHKVAHCGKAGLTVVTLAKLWVIVEASVSDSPIRERMLETSLPPEEQRLFRTHHVSWICQHIYRTLCISLVALDTSHCRRSISGHAVAETALALLATLWAVQAIGGKLSPVQETATERLIEAFVVERVAVIVLENILAKDFI